MPLNLVAGVEGVLGAARPAEEAVRHARALVALLELPEAHVARGLAAVLAAAVEVRVGVFGGEEGAAEVAEVGAAGEAAHTGG